MKKINPLTPQMLRRQLNVSELNFKTTEELEILSGFIGQERALGAVNFGIGIKSFGYNLYTMGPSGLGKRSLITTFLEEHAKKFPPPPDWCYVHNFTTPEKPIALKLPAGVGIRLQQDMKHFIDELSTSILTMFESDQYRVGMQKINEIFHHKREEFLKENPDTLKTNLVPHLYKERHEKEKALQLKFASIVVEPLLVKLIKSYAEYPEVIEYLNAVHADIILHVNDVVVRDENTGILSFSMDSPILVKYQINLFVDNSEMKCAPVIFEDHPSYANLIARVEHINQFGIATTNFTLIKAGSLHRANGGYLIIEAEKIKKEKSAWASLKRALYSEKIIIEPVEGPNTVKPLSLEPLPIPLDVKIILLGERSTYYDLIDDDSDFNELFKVTVDFDENIDRTPQNIHLYTRLIATIIHREKLKPFSADAVAAIIDHSSRLAEDIDKLTAHIRSVDNLILESNYWSEEKKKNIVDHEDVKQAIVAQIHRLDRSRELYYEEIQRNFILIDTETEKIGQINCLSVVKAGKFSYGHPTRLTVKARAGKGKIIDIQREIHMAGPIHSKAGLIISNFLADRYPDDLFSLYASISFEQIYGRMEGDSASVAELCALLSVLSEVPIKQAFAVTGSIDQYGNVQSVGGLNEKIEGFFDICKRRNLTGDQGVLIPKVNAKNLMLREDVVQAVKQKQFFIYPIEFIDEAVYLLLGRAVGERNKQGAYPKSSINYKVEKKLKEFSRQQSKRKDR